MSLSSCARPLAGEHDGVVLDLDGVVYRSAHAVPGAVEVLAELGRGGRPVAYVTNNAARTPASIAKQLSGLGIEVAEEEIVTSAQAIAKLMAAELPPRAPVLVVGGEGLRQAVLEAGLDPITPGGVRPVAVVQGYFPDAAWTDLAEVAYAVQDGVPWYVSNTDLTIPTSRGIAPGNGSLVQAVQNATRSAPQAIAGKPHRPLFDVTLERLGAADALMVGDRLDTDIAGARAAGLSSLAVLTGVSTLADIAAAEPSHRPDFVAPDLNGLLIPHPPLRLEAGSARCGAAAAHYDGGLVSLTERGAGPVEELRAVVGLAWAIRDTSGRSPRLDGTLDT